MSDTPTDTPSDVPTDTPADAPTDTPADAPTDTPADAPTDTHTPVTNSVDASTESVHTKYNDASYFQYQQRLFYELFADCLVNWIIDINKPVVADKPVQIKSFIETWTYALYTRGIKRRRITYGQNLPDLSTIETVDELPNIVELREQNIVGQSMEADAKYLLAVKSGNAFQQLFYGTSSSVLLQFYYDKRAPGFNKSDPLTMFCRHIVFDLNSLSIISTGLPGAIDYDNFIMSQGSDGICIEEFLEGTMLVYNQRLGQFGQQSVTTTSEQSIEPESNQKPTATVAQNDWALSTRRKLGTSFFNNPGKTFDQMFNDNNVIAHTDLTQIPCVDYLDDKVLVFNLEHSENRVVNPITNNRNTLVAVYQLPGDFNNVQKSVNSLLNIAFNAHMANTSSSPSPSYSPSPSLSPSLDLRSDTLEMLYDGLKQIVMAHALVAEIKQLNVQAVVTDLMRLGVKGLNVPTRLFTYHGTEPLTVINSMIKNMDQYMAGVMLKTANETRRSKIRNPVHYNLLRIKGTRPITISDRNKHNLFEVYWNLRQRGLDAIQQFLEVFDNNLATYKNIFTWYEVLINGMNHQLFQEYHNVFVRKSMLPHAISYAFKPLCGELHKIYKTTRIPVSRDTVTQFITKLDHNQVYWRLFGIDA